ncbi:AAA family ATPase [Thermocatellispora tengchongensis]|uniref:AAA family ATPase n=1 Tax=Thermocatellispora tengchongensis TaxID=1073253 RepID=UPI003643E823
MTLVGRKTEMAQILDIVEGRTSGPRLLLLLGEAGTGKTSLVTAAAEHARDDNTLVLMSQAGEAASQQSFASLHRLLLPLLPDVGMLAEHLRRALETALGIAAAEGQPDPMLLHMAALTLLTGVSRRQRVLLVVDDVQHFDRDSLDVLRFVMRRVAMEDVSVLLAARGQTPPEGVAADVPTLLLGPLAEQAAAELVDAQPYPPVGRARIDVLEQAQGNPLAIIELCRAVRTGGARALPGDGLSQTQRIQEMYVARLRALPQVTRRLILYAAASECEDLATIMAAAGVGRDLSVWAPAEGAGLVSVVAGRVVFRHPLVRAGCYQGAPAFVRQRVHRDLAGVLVSDPAGRAWHLAAACLGRDEVVAAALEDSAEFVLRRGGYFAAARALERAAECSPVGEDGARRYAKALRAVNNVGDPSWARELYEKITALTEDRDLLALAARGGGLSLSLSGHQRQGFQVLMSVLEPDPPSDRAIVIALAAVLKGIAFQSGLPEFRRPIAALLDEPETGSHDTLSSEPAMAESLTAVRAMSLAGTDPRTAPELLRRVRRPNVPEPHAGFAEMTRLLAFAGIAWYADESDLAVESLRQAYALFAAYGSMGTAVLSFAPMASALIDTGRWAEADRHLEEAATWAAVYKLRHIEIDIEALRITLAAIRGQRVGMPADTTWTAVDLEENRATHTRLLRAAGAAAAAAGISMVPSVTCGSVSARTVLPCTTSCRIG